METQTIRTKSTNAVLVAVRNSNLGPLQRLKVRLALLNDSNREEIEEFILIEAKKDSTTSIAQDATIEAIDWDKLAAFIEKILPLILKIISMF